MFNRMLTIAVISVLIPFFTGCATILTAAAPPQTTYEEGKPFPGEPSGATYSIGQEQRRIILYKKDTCPEMKEKTRFTRKLPRGMIIAILEVPLLGLGVADLVASGLYSKISEERIFEENAPTGKLISCGEKSPAGGEDIIVEIPEIQLHRTMTTNRAGEIDLTEILKDQKGDVFVKLCLKSDQTCRWNIVH